MADIIIKQTEKILSRVASENEKLGNKVQIWLRKGPNGECIAKVVPCKITTNRTKGENSKGVEKVNWVRKIFYDPANFDVSEEEWEKFVDDVWGPIRNDVKKSIILFMKKKDDSGVNAKHWFELMTINAYKGKDGEAIDLPTSLKEEFLQQATGKVIDFLLGHMMPEIKSVAEKTEKYVDKKFT